MDTQTDGGGYQSPALEKEAYAWLVRLRSEGLTSEDAEAFQRWCRLPGHAQVYARIRETWRALGPVAQAVHEKGVREKALHDDGVHAEGLHEAGLHEAGLHEAGARAHRPDPVGRRGRSAPDTRRYGRRAFLGGALAASAAYVLVRPPMGLWPGITDFAADYRTGTGEQREIALAGGAVVQMNTRTRLNVGGATGDADGIELLGGEAEIDTGMGRGLGVASARPAGGVVSVLAAGGRATAWSARFNIRRDGAEVCLTCLEGEVMLEHAQRTVRIGQGRQVNYGENGVSAVSQVDAADVSAWRNGILVFKDTPLATAVDEINRYRPGKLVLMNSRLGHKRVQLRLSIAQLDEAAEMIRAIYGADLTQLPGGVVLLS
jgi:ferric-dicitrate binding protein FerR (iron transport regulator)